jgi:HK97 family phage portal protein
MNDSIYSLSLTRTSSGDFVADKGADLAGAMSFPYAIPLGAAYSDMFRKDKAPSPRELIQQLVGTAYACATLNSDLVASTSIRMYVITRPGDPQPKSWLRPVRASRKALARFQSDPAFDGFVAGDTTVQEVTHHPLLSLLRNPQPDPNNPGLSGYDFRWMTQLYLESVGRAYWLVERDGLGMPAKLWLLRSHLVREVHDPTGQQILQCYQYGRATYDPGEIIRFHFPDPENPYLNGYSPLMAAIEKIRISRREDAHLNAMLENMGRPDAVWSPRGDSEGGGIGAAEAQRVRSAFRQAFAQAGRGGLLVSEIPGTLQPLQWAPQDVVEIERAKAIKTDICNVFAVPDAKLERNAANLAGAKTADYAHKVDAGVPRCRRIEETLNARLLPMFDNSGRLFIAYESPVPEDEVFSLEQTRTASMSGAITRNEIRDAVGLDPVPWGDAPLVPNNMVAVDINTGKPQALPAEPPAEPVALEEDKALSALADASSTLARVIELLEQAKVSHTPSNDVPQVDTAAEPEPSPS